jgi:MFS family permease
MRTAPAVSLLGAAGLLVGAALFFSEGSSEDRLFPLGTAAILLTAVAGAAVLLGLVPSPALAPPARAFLGLLAAFTVWTGLSVRWSIAPDASWAAFNRNLVYLSFAVLGLLAGALAPRAPRVVASVLALLLAFVLGWALLGKVVPSLFPDGARLARLREPVDYWNALALLGAIALVLALWLASCRTLRPVVRAAGVLLGYTAIVATILTYSRAGIAVAVLATLTWLAVGGRTFDTLAALLLAAPAAIGVGAWALSLSGIADDNQPAAARVHDGHLFGVVLVVVAGAVFAVALAAARRETRRAPSREAERRAVTGALAVVALAGAVLVAVLVARGGGLGAWLDARWDEFRNPQTPALEGPARITNLSSDNRWYWWQEAWRSFREHPLAGQGAGSFPLVHRHERTNSADVTQPHNILLQLLSDMGIVGFLLFVAALVAAAIAAAAAIRRLAGVDRAAAIALAIAAASYLVHALVDFDWDFLAVTAPTLFVLGVLAPAGEAAARRRTLWAVGAAALALVAVSSLAAPWLAERRLDGALGALTRGDTALAAAKAEDAHDLNPLAVDPLLIWGLADAQRHRYAAAYRRYREAVDLQPENADTWFALGAFELSVLDSPRVAHAHLARAHELDPYGAEGELDRLIREAERRAKRRARSS